MISPLQDKPGVWHGLVLLTSQWNSKIRFVQIRDLSG